MIKFACLRFFEKVGIFFLLYIREKLEKGVILGNICSSFLAMVVIGALNEEHGRF